MSQVLEDAHVVLFPAFAGVTLSDSVQRFLSRGGCSILLGETREEYVVREMSRIRKEKETAEDIHTVVAQAASLSGNLITAVDQELGGICRLHGLVPAFPCREDLARCTAQEIEIIAGDVAAAAKAMGVNCFLAPVLDCVVGENPWLQGRTWSTDPNKIGELSSAFIRGVQTMGVATTAKHFPGYSRIELDPAVESEARSREPLETFESGLIPFAQAIENGVEMIMTGPAIVDVFDPVAPASLSPAVISELRVNLGFRGVVMSDDLDAEATLRGRPITRVAVDALRAGSDFLLIADVGDQVGDIVSAIVNSVQSGELREERLHEAAERVRGVARKYA
ncbi:MAG: glycoside hydrolase [Desulfovibrio sp.]|nr:MAG: glycoside hydrolase [Desulfovibrio sp.]